jgi:hypothetical protein
MEEANNFDVLNVIKPCGEPAELVDFTWNDLHIDNFTCQGNYSNKWKGNVKRQRKMAVGSMF